jgi:integrase
MGVKIREKVKGSNEWWVFIDHKGRRKAKRVGSHKAAQDVKAKIEALITLGQPYLEGDTIQKHAPTPTLEEYYERFKLTYLATAVRETTRISYDVSFRHHILPELGKLRLDKIERGRIKEFVAKLVGKQLARPTIRIITAELNAVYNAAIEDGITSGNPARRLSKFYKQAPIIHEEIEPLTREEVVTFLQAVLKHSPDSYPLFLCAIHTGLRSGEIAGLQWCDIDWSGKFITVRNNLVRGRIHSTKTDKTRRVDMSDDLLTELSDLKRHRKEEWLSRGENEIPEWVFCNREGNPVDMHNVKNRQFFKCLEKAGLRRMRFHDLRHTHASLLIQDGQSLKYVSDQLGHSSIKMTADVYGHLVPGANRQAVNRLPSLRESPKDCAESAKR